MKNIIFIVSFIIGILFFEGCSTKNNIKPTINNRVLNGNINTVIFQKQEDHYILKKLCEENISHTAKPVIDMQRRNIVNKYGNEFTKSDSIIIVESYVGMGSSYEFLVYTSLDKKIKSFHEKVDSNGLMILKETNIKQDEVIDYVLTGKLMKFVENNERSEMSPETTYTISMFYKNNKNEYVFSYIIKVK